MHEYFPMHCVSYKASSPIMCCGNTNPKAACNESLLISAASNPYGMVETRTGRLAGNRHGDAAAAGPNASVHAYAAAQVKAAMDATKRLGGENYVFWGGREGYHTLLNTDLKCGT